MVRTRAKLMLPRRHHLPSPTFGTTSGHSRKRSCKGRKGFNLSIPRRIKDISWLVCILWLNAPTWWPDHKRPDWVSWLTTRHVSCGIRTRKTAAASWHSACTRRCDRDGRVWRSCGVGFPSRRRFSIVIREPPLVQGIEQCWLPINDTMAVLLRRRALHFPDPGVEAVGVIEVDGGLNSAPIFIAFCWAFLLGSLTTIPTKAR